MKYMLLIYHDEQGWNTITEAERQQIYLEYRNLRGELESRGQFLSGSELQPISVSVSSAVATRRMGGLARGGVSAAGRTRPPPRSGLR